MAATDGNALGIYVQARGTGKSIVAGAAGGALGAAATMGKESGSPLGVRQIGFLSVSGDQVTLQHAKRKVLLGGFKPTDEVVAEVPRSSIESAQFERGKILGSLEVRFRDGSTWSFEVPKVGNKGAEEAVAAMADSGGAA